jgi:hypothetical protein
MCSIWSSCFGNENPVLSVLVKTTLSVFSDYHWIRDHPTMSAYEHSNHQGYQSHFLFKTNIINTLVQIIENNNTRRKRPIANTKEN